MERWKSILYKYILSICGGRKNMTDFAWINKARRLVSDKLQVPTGIKPYQHHTRVWPDVPLCTCWHATYFYSLLVTYRKYIWSIFNFTFNEPPQNNSRYCRWKKIFCFLFSAIDESPVRNWLTSNYIDLII